MKQKFKETTIGRRRYRIVRCKTCGKITNAYENGNKDAGILYSCIFCRGRHKGGLEPVTKEEAYAFILAELETAGILDKHQRNLDKKFA